MRSVHIRTGRVSALALVSTMLVVLTVVLVANINTEVEGDDPIELYIKEQPSDQYIHDRTNAVFAITAVNVESYQWEFAIVSDTPSWKSVSKGNGAGSAMLVISPSDYSGNEYMFRCVLTDADDRDMISQPAYLYITKTATTTAKNVHYVGSVEDLFKIGDGKEYDGVKWDLDDTYIQIADIDFTDPNNETYIEGKMGSGWVFVAYDIDYTNEEVTFYIQESEDGANFYEIKLGTTLYYNFGMMSGEHVVNDGFTIKNEDSKFDGSPMVFSVGGKGEYGNFAISLEVSGPDAEGERTSYSNGNFIPIGSADQPFAGLYDGRGYTITGMETAKYVGEDAGYIGMFASSTGVIQNLCLEGGSSTALMSGTPMIAGAAGIVGLGKGSIYNSYNTGIVGSNAFSGGIVSNEKNSDTEIKDCYNFGTVGGLVSGGISGYAMSQISNCFNTGNVTGTDIAGGISAQFAGKNIVDTNNSGEVMARGTAGGIAADVLSSRFVEFERCYNAGAIRLYSENISEINAVAAGGIVALVQAQASVNECYNTGDIFVSDIDNTTNDGRQLYVGGIAGRIINASGKSVSNCSNYGYMDVYVGQPDANIYSFASIGGIAGYTKGTAAQDSGIVYSFNESDIFVLSSDDRTMNIGGIVGNGSTVDQCGNHGKVNCFNGITKANVGGIAGMATDISSCYNLDNVVGPTEKVGGISYSAANVKESYNIGLINVGNGAGIIVIGDNEGSYYLEGNGMGNYAASDYEDLKNTVSHWVYSDLWYYLDGTNYPLLKIRSPSDAKIITHPADVTAKDNTIVRFSVEVDAENAHKSTYQWQISGDGKTNWADIGRERTSDYQTSTLGLDDSWYRCIIIFDDETFLYSMPAKFTTDNDSKIVHTEVCLTEDGPGTGGYVYPGGILRTADDEMDLVIMEMEGYTLTKVTIGGMNGTDVTQDVKDDAGEYEYLLGATGNYIWAFFTPIFDATVNVLLDGEAYKDYVGTVYLKQKGEVKASTDVHVDGTYTFTGINTGTYNVFLGETDIKQTVSATSPTVDINYYTVNFELSIISPATDASTISAKDGSGKVVNKGDAVLKGTKIIIIAVGKGALGNGCSYTYSWTDTAVPSLAHTESIYSPTINSKSTIVCKVTGHSGTVDAKISMLLNDLSHTGYSGYIELKGEDDYRGETHVNGIFEIEVIYGNYKVFANGVDTGQTISGSDPTANVDFYSVEYTVTDDPNGTSQGSTIDSQQVTSGGAVLKGTGITIEVTAKGSAGKLPTYQYSWTNYASTTNVLVIPGVGSKVSTVCTVLGTDGDTSAPTYTITASADPGAFISPSGKITAERGSSKSFTFGALDGYFVSDVIIDGISHPELVNGSSYTFSNIINNHSIVIKNTRSLITLNVAILEGKGHVEYKVNGGSFITYTGEVTLAENSDLVLRAYADEGYNFVRWSGDRTSTEWEISIDDVINSVHLQVTFESSNGGSGGLPDWAWYVIAALLILLALLLILLLVFYRRTYEIVKIESSATIIGKDRARRNRAYIFEIDGNSAKVSYRVGEDGQWRSLVPNEDGKYIIPREDVVDKIAIEA